MTQPATLELTGVHARSPYPGGPGQSGELGLRGASCRLGPGVHAVLGTPADGSLAFAAAALGRVRPAAGTVRVAGLDPWSAPKARAQIAALAPRPELPDLPRFADVVAAAGRAAGWDSRGSLQDLGLGALARRAVRSASLAERRAVELAIALGHPEPRLLLLHEPLRRTAAPGPAELWARVRTRAEGGTCVVLIASTPVDLLGAVDSIHVLNRGLALGLALDAADPLPSSPELMVWVDAQRGGGARALAAALAGHEELTGVGWQSAAGPAEAPGPGMELLAVRGRQLEAAALLVARHAEQLGVAVRSVHSAAPTLAQLVALASRRADVAAAAPAPTAASPAGGGEAASPTEGS